MPSWSCHISSICLSGAPQDWLGQFWPHSPSGPTLLSPPTAPGELLEPSWACGCRRGPSMLTGLQLCCASEDCSRGMQACSNLPGRALGLTWHFYASSTSRGCRVSHAAQPGWRQAGQALPQGSVPLLLPFNCSCTALGLWKSRGTHPCEGQSCRTQQAEKSPEQSEQQECTLSLPEKCQPSSGNGAHPFPHPWPRGSPRPALPHRRASPGVLWQQ